MKRKQLASFEPVDKSMEVNGYLLEAQLLRINDKNVLEVDVFEKGRLWVRHFLCEDENDYDSLFVEESTFPRKKYLSGEWGKITLRGILAKGEIYWYEYGCEIACGILSKSVIETYCDRENHYSTKPFKMIESIENEITYQRESNKYYRKVERIKKLMAAVEPVTNTEEFENWIRKVFPNDFLLAETRQQQRGFKCRCTACEKNYFSKEKPKHNQIVRCKKCGKEIMVKTRVQYVEEKKNVLVAQQVDSDTWVLRHFRFRSLAYQIMKKGKRSITHCEKMRIMIHSSGKCEIYYGNDRDYGATEFTQDWWDKRRNIVTDHSFVMYPGRLPDVNMDKQLKHLLICGAQSMQEMDWNQLVRCYKKHPYMEYLLKGRYFKLANEIIKIHGWWSRPEELFDLAANNTTDLLQLDAQRAYRLRDMNGGRYTLEMLQHEIATGEKISQINLKFAEENKISSTGLETKRTKMTINKAMNYIRRQMERNHMGFKEVTQYYKDYLDMAEQRQMDLTDDIVRANARMIEFHMQYLEELNRINNEKRATELAKKFPNIEKDYMENCKRMAWENEEYVILVPRNVLDIIQEGQKQHHCVASSDRYFKSMNDHESFILMLRKKEKIEVPYYTLEVTWNSATPIIKQRYAAYDRTPEVKKVDKVLRMWKEDIQKRIKQQKAAV